MQNPIAKKLEAFSEKQGEVTSFIVYPLLFIVVYEVFMRYVFNAPTTWGFEATTFLYGLHYMFGLTYTDLFDGHVKVDIFSSRMTDNIQRFLKIFTNLFFFMPVMSCLTIWSFKFAYQSTLGRELNPTSWAPPIWPLKILMAVCFLFLLLQGIANLINDITKPKQSK